jgi:hypothetical protein
MVIKNIKRSIDVFLSNWDFASVWPILTTSQDLSSYLKPVEINQLNSTQGTSVEAVSFPIIRYHQRFFNLFLTCLSRKHLRYFKVTKDSKIGSGDSVFTLLLPCDLTCLGNRSWAPRHPHPSSWTCLGARAWTEGQDPCGCGRSCQANPQTGLQRLECVAYPLPLQVCFWKAGDSVS